MATGSGNAADRRDYDIPSSQDAQGRFNSVASLLEALIDARNNDVQKAMADYAADGVSDEYLAKELRWRNVADEVKGIIHTLRQSMGSNDETAGHSLQMAKAAVASIG